MRIRELSIYGCGTLILAVFLTIGCSEERKREAAKLENQLKGDTTAQVAVSPVSADTLTRPHETIPESSQTPAVVTLAVDSSVPQPVAEGHAEAVLDSPRSASTRTETEPVADVNAVPEEGSGTKPQAVMPKEPHDGFTIQVGSSLSEGYAQEMAKTFTERGYQAYVASVTVDGKTHYRIRVGFYGSTVEAKSVLAELKNKYSVDGWIDPVSK